MKVVTKNSETLTRRNFSHKMFLIGNYPIYSIVVVLTHAYGTGSRNESTRIHGAVPAEILRHFQFHDWINRGAGIVFQSLKCAVSFCVGPKEIANHCLA